MILRFVLGLTTLATTFIIYFMVTTVGATSERATSEQLNAGQDAEHFAQDWQTTLCTPPDEVLGELVWLDPNERLSVDVLEDEAFSWGLLAPDTSVLVDYTPSTLTQDQSSSVNLCEGDFSMINYGQTDQVQPELCHHVLKRIGQAQ